MYEGFYKFKAEPFRLSPDHNFCYSHKSYSKAKAYMQYAFQRAEGFVMVTGKPGTGKTTLVNDLIDSLSSSRVKVAMLVCTQLEADDLLRMVAFAFGLNVEETSKAVILQKLGRLLVSHYKEGRRVLLIIDEAQDLSPSALEELRLLTNLQLNSRPLLQIFLLGQQELKSLVQKPSMEQVRQRLVAACHLESLKLDETKAYIRHRLKQVGWRGDPAVSEAIFPVIHKFSLGVPRRINLICSRLLLHGCVEEKHVLGIDDARTVMSEIQNEQLMNTSIPTELDFSVEDYFDLSDISDLTTLKTAPGDSNQVPAQSHRPANVKPIPILTNNVRSERFESTEIKKDSPGPRLKAGKYETKLSVRPVDIETHAATPPAARDKATLPDAEIPSKNSRIAESSADSNTPQKFRYAGPDSRRKVRRQTGERRKEIRFEPGKEDRRKSPGRRKGDNSGGAWKKSVT